MKSDGFQRFFVYSFFVSRNFFYFCAFIGISEIPFRVTEKKQTNYNKLIYTQCKIKLLAILLAIACIYQLSFSLKARSVEKKAAEYAAKVSESDSLRQAAEIYYLDSVQNRPVYDLGFISFTYKEVKEKEINLGLDLKGGMNVMLEVQVRGGHRPCQQGA